MPYAIKKETNGMEQFLCVNIINLGYHAFGTIRNLLDMRVITGNFLATVEFFDSVVGAREFITANPSVCNPRENNIICEAINSPNGYSFIPVVE